MSNDAPAWLSAPPASSAAPPPRPAPAAEPAASNPFSANSSQPRQQQQPFGGVASDRVGRGGGIDTIEGLSSAYDWTSAFWVQHVIRVCLLGCAILLATVSALSLINVGNASGDKEAQIVFVSMYLFLFSSIMFAFEVTRYFPNDTFESVFLRNFGVLYGPIGRGLAYAFVGVLALGNVEVGDVTEELAIGATSVTCAFGFLQILVHLLRPEWSDPAMDIRVFPKGVLMQPKL